MIKHEQNLSNLAINIKKILYNLLKAKKIILELEFITIKRLKITYANGKF